MKDITAGQIKALCDLCLSHGLLMSLFFHQLRAGRPKLNAGKSVDRIVNAAVAGASGY